MWIRWHERKCGLIAAALIEIWNDGEMDIQRLVSQQRERRAPRFLECMPPLTRQKSSCKDGYETMEKQTRAQVHTQMVLTVVLVRSTINI